MSPMIGQLTDGGVLVSVAPMCRFPNGKYEMVVAVVYSKEGLPITAVLASEGREVAVAEIELIDPLPEYRP